MKEYFTKLDALRGIAAFGVVLFHSTFYYPAYQSSFVHNSYLFVDLFFILSGFVITNAYKDKIENSLKFRDFFLLRLGRIYPLHLFMLVLWIFYLFGKWILFNNGIEFVDPLIRSNFKTLFTNLILIHSLNIHGDTSWNYPSWSISLEFYTYLIFFAFAYLFRGKSATIFALITSLASYGYLLQFVDSASLDFTVQKGIFRCIGGFFAGVFLYHYINKNSTIENKILMNLLEISTVCLVFYCLTFAANDKAILLMTIPAFFATIAVFSNQHDGLIGKLLKTKILQNCGKYSYSIYMIHALVIDIVFSFAKYLIIKPTVVIFFIETEYAFVINIGFIIVIYWLAKLTYFKIEKVWLEKSKNFVNEMNEFEKSKNDISILFD
jgi:peptidoglycan/LPS O-acetylase OafA/YrhL